MDGKPKYADSSSSFSLECAEKFRDGLDHLGLLFIRPKLPLWAKEFEIILKVLVERRNLSRHDAERLLQTELDDHILHVQYVYQPEAHSAKTFREKFAQIENARKRRLQQGIFAPGTLEITKETEVLVVYLKGLSWPKNSQIQLPTVVQLSFNSIRPFRNGLSSLSEKFLNVDKWLSVFSDVLSRSLPTSYEMIQLFYEQENHRVQKWSAWNGQLKPLTVEHRWFHNILAESERNYFGRIRGDKEESSYWYALLAKRSEIPLESSRINSPSYGM